jgi:hypothetical protein
VISTSQPRKWRHEPLPSLETESNEKSQLSNIALTTRQPRRQKMTPLEKERKRQIETDNLQLLKQLTGVQSHVEGSVQQIKRLMSQNTSPQHFHSAGQTARVKFL